MTQSTIVFPENADAQPGFERFETILTVNDLKKRFLHGVVTTDKNGKSISRSTYEFYIRSAISQLEHDYEITITPTRYKNEMHDYKADEYWNWCLLQLRHKPVVSVESMVLRVTDPAANPPMAQIPASWIRLNRMNGQIQLAPISGSIGTFNIGNTTFLPRILIFNDTFPGFYDLTYVAGFEQDKIPTIINMAIGILATIPVLNAIGELILGPGISSTSIGIDGLSQSVSSTASAMYGAYAARIEDYKSELKRIDGILKKYYGKKIKCLTV